MAATAAFAMFMVMIMIVVMMAVTTAATTLMATVSVDFTVRVCFNQHSHFVKNSSIFGHLIAQRLVLFGDGAEEGRGITKKLGSELGMCWHGKTLS